MSEGQRESSWISRLNNRLDGTQAKVIDFNASLANTMSSNKSGIRNPKIEVRFHKLVEIWNLKYRLFSACFC